ncbi:hypothetical protein K503DRAFT_770550 [Rhizopogon vinicolor AM-OR11-026]|uniref:RING-type domain-containing protein n=1 Tax=Rhizopogon vinicolor AM-OR11-026 TaxID=1314800 RepID=A0A1B7N0K2_9AGAM|nr:hypothetical protein K503DRAFT_770550 [Rhizopogon vinicolor AM-OR11-026]
MASNQSLNHLLNFTLPPRQTQPQSLPRRSRKTVNPAVWNKERFVNAQYRFVMNPSGDYTVHFADPDIFFQWHDILQVVIPRSSAFSAAAGGEHVAQEEGIKTCPICLSPPTAPRMTKCGHVYCFPCILHYLSMSDNKWARCPICFDTLNEKQLKSVKWYDGPRDDQEPDATGGSSSTQPSDHEAAPRAGSTMRMRLMQRPQMTTLALPRSHTWLSDLIPPHQAPFYFLPDVYNYAKFMLATPDYLIADLSNDLDALAVERRMMASMQDELGISFIDAAEQKLRHQIAKAAALESPQLKEAIDRAQRDCEDIDRRHNVERERKLQGETKGSALPEAPEAFLAIHSSSGYFAGISRTSPSIPTTPKSAPSPALAPTLPTNAPSNNRNHRQRRNINPPPPSTQTYYYYQAASGLPIFLHPLDIKVLFAHFNSYASFPDTITVRVESAAEGTVNDELRKRCKYLAHIPEGADVVFIEADLEAVVGQEGLKNFEGAIKLRKSRRKEKGKKDDRARVRAEEREREKVIAPWRDSVVSVPLDSVVHPVEVEEIVDHDSPAPQISGAWGSRSFASAAHSASRTDVRHSNTNNRTASQEIADEWELDAAWHELEQRSTAGNGNKNKRGNKLVVLGGGAGGRRR